MTTQAATLGSVTTWQVDPAHTHVEFAVKHLHNTSDDSATALEGRP